MHVSTVCSEQTRPSFSLRSNFASLVGHYQRTMEQGSERFGRHIIHATNNLFVILIMLRWFEEPHRFSKLRFFHNLFSLFLLPRPPFPCPILGLSFFFVFLTIYSPIPKVYRLVEPLALRRVGCRSNAQRRQADGGYRNKMLPKSILCYRCYRFNQACSDWGGVCLCRIFES